MRGEQQFVIPRRLLNTHRLTVTRFLFGNINVEEEKNSVLGLSWRGWRIDRRGRGLIYVSCSLLSSVREQRGLMAARYRRKILYAAP